MKKIVSLLLATALAFSSMIASAKYDLPWSAVIEYDFLRELRGNSSGEKDATLLYPPEKHPYIFVNQEYINMLKANKDGEVYKQAYSAQLALAKKELPEQPDGGYLSTSISNQLCARAFMYVMGEVDKAHAKKTVEYTIEYLKNAKSKQTYSIDIYKDFGTQGIQCGALIYDWCYDVLEGWQKSELADVIVSLMNAPEQPCRPDNVDTAWEDLNGKTVGQPLIYNSIACSAIYDQYPDIYDTMMKKIQGTMAEASKIYGEAAALTDGSIAYSREYYTYTIEILFQRMGHDIRDKYGVQLPLGQKLMYTRLPYGLHMKVGDSFGITNYNLGDYRNTYDIANDMGLLQTMFDDPYLKHYYERENHGANGILDMLTKKSTIESKTPDDLPLAFEAYDPRSEIIAKTSWQEGLDSPQVSAYLNMNNRRSGDHDHAELGSFQLHYKGPLSIANGTYSATNWGVGHWSNYLVRSVSKNTMLVYDPSETFKFGPSIAEANDGGQKLVVPEGGGYAIVDLEEHMLESNRRATTQGTYIGPNEKTPAFSYIKGDLTNAYAEKKMGQYNRSMVFMDTFNETYPGVLLVFDRVVSTKSAYPKTWLLQAVAEPIISGNKITIDNSKSDEKANGKLVNTVLLPEKADIEAVGGIKKFIVNGKEYPQDAENGGTDLYNSGWRAEVKPSSANEEDIFLNAMFVADADTTAPDIEMIKLEDNNFYGVVTLDRQVMFSKDTRPLNNEFKLAVSDNNSGEKMLVLLTDVSEGKWKISGNGIDIIAESKATDNAFVFAALPGEYTISPVSADTEVTEINWPQVKKEPIGDFSIKLGTTYQYMREPNKLIDGVPYVGESFIKYSTPYSSERNGNTFKVTLPDGSISTFTAGNKEFTVIKNGIINTKSANSAPFIDENGVFYVNPQGTVASALGINTLWIKSAASMNITLNLFDTSASGTLEGVDESRVLSPISIFASSDDGNQPLNLIDRNLGSRWSSNMGDNEWCAFKMSDEPIDMSAVQIAFYNGDKRHWKFDIQISDNGTDWETVLKDQRSEGISKNVETFMLPEGTKAQYIRYLGHGEEVTAAFYNSITEFIVIK